MNGGNEGLDASLIRWIALLPMLSAVVHGLLIGLARARISRGSVRALSMCTLASAFVLSAASLFEWVGAAGGTMLIDTVGPWVGGGVGPRSFSAELGFQLDPLSAVLCLTITGVALAVYVHAVGRARDGGLPADAEQRTFATMDLLVGSTLVLVLADNFLLFFVGWAGVGVATQLFASFRQDEHRSARAGATAFVIGRIGDLGLLASMLLLFDGLARSGAPSITFRGIEGAYRLLEGQEPLIVSQTGIDAPLLLEFIGFGLALAAITKCAQLPLSIWLPGANRGPVPAVALMQSVTTVLAGTVVLLRFSFLLVSAPITMAGLFWIGLATLVLASLAAANQLELDRLWAYTTSAHLGLVMATIGVGAFSTATYHLWTHAFVKALVLLAFGVAVTAMRGENDLRRLGGIGPRMRQTQALAAIGCLALVGLPPLAIFFSLEELLASLASASTPLSSALHAAFLFGIAVLAFAVGRAFFLVFRGNVVRGGRSEQRLQDASGWTQYGMIALAVMSVAAGGLTPSQFWGDLWGIAGADSIGHFLSTMLAGPVDPALEGGARWRSLGGLVLAVVAGLGWAAWRHARRGYRGEPSHRLGRVVSEALRDVFYLEELYRLVLVRPLRAVSRGVLAVGVEQRLIDRVVVSGGSQLVRRVVWDGLRRVQNGHLQSYTLLGLLTAVVIVTYMVMAP